MILFYVLHVWKHFSRDSITRNLRFLQKNAFLSVARKIFGGGCPPLNWISAEKKIYVSLSFLSTATYIKENKIGGGHLPRFRCKSLFIHSYKHRSYTSYAFHILTVFIYVKLKHLSIVFEIKVPNPLNRTRWRWMNNENGKNLFFWS